MILIGTSGYNYPEWRGSFYPSDMPTDGMLAYYAARFPTVEINYTFYRMPTEKVLAEWARGTPEGFTFTLKAPRRITHDARLREADELLAVFCERAQALGSKLGVLLFQLPPSLRRDLEAFDAFLDWLPVGLRAAFEFRHASWLTEEVYARLRARNLALCIADSERMTTPVVPSADYGYLRLRDEGYQEEDIAHWADVVREHAAEWRDTFVYFKHEEEGKGPAFARLLTEALQR